VLLALNTLSACAIVSDALRVTEVKPWQRGALAREDMRPVADAIEKGVDDHIYFSKEGSTGGSSVQGGGCGCN